MLVVFALTMGLSGGGMPMLSTVYPATAGNSVGDANIARVQSRCCMDKQLKDRSGSTRCLSDCSFSITAVAPLVIPVTRSAVGEPKGTVQSRYAGTVFRPPIV